jgi:lipopolysaccharide transport system permease protein
MPGRKPESLFKAGLEVMKAKVQKTGGQPGPGTDEAVLVELACQASARVVIEPPSGWQTLNLREIWQYRELLYFLAWRDVKVRYKQTAIGAAWAVLQPLLTMVVFSILFGRLMEVSTGDLPYPIFAYVALLPWTFFAGALSRSGHSLVYDANLISKVYFPRLILPFAAVLSMLVDFAISFVILLGLMLFYGIVPGPALVFLPFFLLLAFLTALGIGLWLSALNVKYRDIAYVIPFLTQFWLFLTPVAYPSTLVPQQWKLLYSLNPMTGVIEGFRWALLGQQNLPLLFLALSAAAVLLLFVGGLFYFRRMEYEFADMV